MKEIAVEITVYVKLEYDDRKLSEDEMIRVFEENSAYAVRSGTRGLRVIETEWMETQVLND